MKRMNEKQIKVNFDQKETERHESYWTKYDNLICGTDILFFISVVYVSI